MFDGGKLLTSGRVGLAQCKGHTPVIDRVRAGDGGGGRIWRVVAVYYSDPMMPCTVQGSGLV